MLHNSKKHLLNCSIGDIFTGRVCTRWYTRSHEWKAWVLLLSYAALKVCISWTGGKLCHLCCCFDFFRWGRQRHRKRYLSRSPEPRKRAQPGGHGGCGLNAAGPEASEGCLLLLLRQPPRKPQEEEEQKQTQVLNKGMRHGGISMFLKYPCVFWITE